MTKKHFIALAKSLASVRPTDETSEAYMQWLRDVNAVENVLGGLSGTFDCAKFHEVCSK
jgi:hypothetical protein